MNENAKNHLTNTSKFQDKEIDTDNAEAFDNIEVW